LEEGKKKDNILFQILHLEEGKKKIAEWISTENVAKFIHVYSLQFFKSCVLETCQQLMPNLLWDAHYSWTILCKLDGQFQGFFLFFQFCDVAEVMIIHKMIYPDLATY
jgi:hypothetical protein